MNSHTLQSEEPHDYIQAEDRPHGREVNMSDALPNSNPGIENHNEERQSRRYQENISDTESLVGLEGRNSLETDAEKPLLPSQNYPGETACECVNCEFSKERALRQKLETELEGYNIALAQERSLHEETQKQLEAEKEGMKVVRGKWKQAARDLNKMQTQNQGFYQITEDYLIDLVVRLRYNIRNLSIQYFSKIIGDITVDPRVASDRDSYFSRFIKSNLNQHFYLTFAERRPSIIQAVLWKAIVEDIFGQFRWAGIASRSIWELSGCLEPTRRSDVDRRSSPNPEAIKRFQAWSATTVGLVLSAVENGTDLKVNEGLQKWKTRFFRDIDEAIGPFKGGRNSGYEEELFRIIDQALDLDKEISRQLSKIDWDFGSDKGDMIFDSSLMELENGQYPTGSKQQVSLVISPAFKKRGKSTGEGFDKQAVLLRMEVSCENPEAREWNETSTCMQV